MSTYSEYTTEYLNCVNKSSSRDGKGVYNYKYCGDAQGILSMYAPACVYRIQIQVDEAYYECRFTKSIQYLSSEYRLVLCDDHKNIDFTKIRKFNVTAYAYNIIPPKIQVTCEHIRKRSVILNSNSSIESSPGSYPNSFPKSRPKTISSHGDLFFAMSPDSNI